MDNKLALITGAARRIGAIISRLCHRNEIDVVIHFHHSQKEAETLCDELNSIRSHSASIISGNINNISDCQRIIAHIKKEWGKLDILINNASSFYPTPFGQVSEEQWQDLLGSNLKGPFFLSQAAAPLLAAKEGNIINIVDIHAEKPLKNYSVYCCAKAGLVMLTKALARELAPKVRVNAIAPGPILWPEGENTLTAASQQHIIDKTCLKRQGSPEDIAETVLFFINQEYTTGQIIAVDGGRSIKD